MYSPGGSLTESIHNSLFVVVATKSFLRQLWIDKFHMSLSIIRPPAQNIKWKKIK